VTDANKKVPADEYTPAPAAQQRLWFLDQLYPGDVSYNMAQAYRIRGKLNRDALGKSLNHIVFRHSALRTTFTVFDNVLLQHVHDFLAIELSTIDHSGTDNSSDAGTAQRLLDEELGRSFDLGKGPLFRYTLYRLSKDEHVLVVSQHHIIFDRTSVGLFVHELTALYNQFDSGDHGADPCLSELLIQYTDYAKWRLENSTGDALGRQLLYWREQMAGMQSLELPTDRPRSRSVTSRGAQMFLKLPAETIDNIGRIARDNGATLFMGLLASFNLLIHQWTGNTDVTVGTPFADRRLNGTKDLLGFFVNTLLLRTKIPDESNFSQLLRNVRNVCFGAYRNSSVPFEKLVEQLNPSREENRNPLFDVHFAFHKRHSRELTLGDLSVESLAPSKKTSQYDVMLTMREQEDGYELRVDYRTDLFDAETIGRLMHRFRHLLDIIGRDPTIPLSDYPLLTGDEYDRSTREWNDTHVEYPSTKAIHSLFEEQAHRTPNSIAVSCGEDSISYKELDRRANRLANFLRHQGFGPEMIAAICVERSIDMVVGLFAILKAGGAYLPLDRTYPDNRLTHMLEDSGAKILLTHSALLDELPDSDARIVLFDSDAREIDQQSDEPPNISVLGESLAYVIYTSGSTGVPKGVQLEHRNVVNFLSSMKHEPGITSDDVLLAVTTLSFDIAVLEIFLPLVVGARTIIASHDIVIDGERLLKVLDSENVTMMQATPVTWRMLIDAGWEGATPFRVLCGGEAMPRELAKALTQCSDNVWNMYGPTETTVWSTCYRLRGASGPLLIGRPIGNTSIYILDRQMRPVPIGRSGELYIGGDGVARGYLNRSSLTAERFVVSPFDEDSAARLYATGDAVRFLPDGNIEYLNRLDNQVKVRGNRIELGEIQAAIVACDEVQQAVVIVREDEPNDPRIVAYFVLESVQSISGSDVRKRLRESLPAYMIPQFFIVLESLPLTPNGKINRNALPPPGHNSLASVDRYCAPRTRPEIVLAAIWQELLNLDRVGVHDNFIELGGHSLLALQAISKTRQELGANVSAMSMIMDTLEQIAAPFDDERPEIGNDGESDVANSVIRPFYFGRDGDLFGMHHQPSGVMTRDISILLCGPIFMESIKAHWALKRLADQLAGLGFHVLRFDYFGSGDSMGDSHEGNVTRWLEDVRSAADELVATSGADKISIVGLRFGASLAAMSEVENVQDLILWDPIVCGRSYMEYLRERHQSLIDNCNDRRRKPVSQSENELLGFICSSESESMIENVDLAKSFDLDCDRVVLVVPEHTQDQGLLESRIDSIGKSVTRLVMEDARCEIDDNARLLAFLPGASLRRIASVLSGES
jgi:amino acid adenylation domain-containing protein